MIVLEPHSMAFNIGYAPTEQLDKGTILIQLLLEIALELLTDNTAAWAETEHDIPVTEYFSRTLGIPKLIWDGLSLAALTFLSVYVELSAANKPSGGVPGVSPGRPVSSRPFSYLMISGTSSCELRT